MDIVIYMFKKSVVTGKNGNGGGTDGEIRRITITLMQEFDKLPNNIIVLAATNRLDILDDAFISRFSIKRKINSFTEEQNKKMIHLFSENEINTIIGSTHSQKEIINRIRRFKCEKIYYLILY